MIYKLTRKMSKCKSATIFEFFLGGGAKRSKDGDDGEACEWWRNLWNSASVLTSRICKV